MDTGLTTDMATSLHILPIESHLSSSAPLLCRVVFIAPTEQNAPIGPPFQTSPTVAGIDSSAQWSSVVGASQRHKPSQPTVHLHPFLLTDTTADKMEGAPPQSIEEEESTKMMDNDTTTTGANATSNDDTKEEGEEGMIDDTHPGGEGGGGSVDGGMAMRPIFFGNLSHNCVASDVENIFRSPVCDVLGGGEDGGEFVLLLLLFIIALSQLTTTSNNNRRSTPSPPHRPRRHETGILLRIPKRCSG